MTEPQKYILEEWDSMCAIANKARQGNCPLIEDEVLVEMHKYVGALDKKVAELEQELIDIRSDYSCACTHKACRVCDQRKSIDKLLSIEEQPNDN